MTWSEFSSLLSGIMPETPLGQIVAIRSEEDRDVLKNFTKDQHQIRNEWRSKQAKSMTEEDARESIKHLQDLFAKAFL